MHNYVNWSAVGWFEVMNSHVSKIPSPVLAADYPSSQNMAKLV